MEKFATVYLSFAFLLLVWGTFSPKGRESFGRVWENYRSMFLRIWMIQEDKEQERWKMEHQLLDSRSTEQWGHGRECIICMIQGRKKK